jgi:threonine dehydratase
MEAMLFAFTRLKLVIEPSAAVSLAAVLTGKFRANGKRVGLILSGGNVDLHLLAKLAQIHA